MMPDKLIGIAPIASCAIVLHSNLSESTLIFGRNYQRLGRKNHGHRRQQHLLK
jgi:hypothetical protein